MELTVFIAICFGFIFGAIAIGGWVSMRSTDKLKAQAAELKQDAQVFINVALASPYGHDVIIPNPDDPTDPTVVREFTDATVQTALITYYNTVALVP